jgi:division/cell wall cluster transcriptional repressor MraZ
MMSGEFLGKFENSVHKSRVIIPASFKKMFSDQAQKSVIVTVGAKGTVAIFPLDNWEMMKQKLQNGSDLEKKLRSNLIYFAMPVQELEGPGRVRISEELLQKAQITDSVIIKGDGHYITLWNPDRLKEISQQKQSEHDELFDADHYQL